MKRLCGSRHLAIAEPQAMAELSAAASPQRGASRTLQTDSCELYQPPPPPPPAPPPLKPPPLKPPPPLQLPPPPPLLQPPPEPPYDADGMTMLLPTLALQSLIILPII